MNVIRGNNFTKCHVISKIGRTNCYRCIFLDVNFIFSFIDILVILKTTKKLYIKKQGSYLHLSNNWYGIVDQYKNSTTLALECHLLIHFKFLVFIRVILVFPFIIVFALFGASWTTTSSDLSTSLFLNLRVGRFV